MSKLVMGYWDCPYCRTKGIEGINQECPNCGATRDRGTKFYIKQGQKTYLTEEQSKNKGKGADWICPYCHALNSITSDKCKDCGGNKYESEENYFGKTKTSIEEKDSKSTIDKPIKQNNNQYNQDTTKSTLTNIVNLIFSRKYLVIFGIIATLFLIISLCVGIYHKTHKTFIPNTFLWETKIEIEHYETCHESDWNIPSGGRETNHESRIHHYNHVIDHYQTVTKSRQVQDGYDVSYTYSDNGDGTFTEHEHRTPRYRTEYYSEEEPVYIDVPVYKTYYFYDIERWVSKYYEVENGTEKTIAWKEYTLKDDTWREGDRIVEYNVKGLIDDKIVTYKCNETIFKQLEAGGKFKIVTNFDGDTITNIKN